MKKLRKKVVLLIIGLVIFIVVTTFLYENANNKDASKPYFISTDSQIIVDKKEHSYDWKQVWIMAHDPNNNSGTLKLIVSSKNAWNLIQTNKEYFASYQKEGKREKVIYDHAPYYLMQITYPGNPDKIALR